MASSIRRDSCGTDALVVGIGCASAILGVPIGCAIASAVGSVQDWDDLIGTCYGGLAGFLGGVLGAIALVRWVLTPADRRTRPSVVLLVLAAIIGAAVSGAVWAEVHPHESSNDVDVAWATSERPMTVAFLVTDFAGEAVSGARVEVENDSGYAGATTGTDGTAVVKMGERGMGGMYLNRVRIVRPRWFLTAADGLSVTITVKNLERFGIAPR